MSLFDVGSSTISIFTVSNITRDVLAKINKKDDGYCNEGNFPEAYIVGNILRYQDLEWYEALKDSKLKEEALKNKAIMEGIIDEDDELNNEGWRRWDNFENTNCDHEEREYEMEHEDDVFIR
ncbi:hypothetical protein Tco_0709164 [Tanacetum coccineum]